MPIEIGLVSMETDDGPLVAATIWGIAARLELEASFEKLYRAADEARDKVELISHERVQQAAQTGVTRHEMFRVRTIRS